MISSLSRIGSTLLRQRLHLFIFTAFLFTTIGFQWAGGAFDSEYGRKPDEAAHYITGLMIRDFIVSLDWSKPLQFAENFYIHYPKVAIGHWPPLFYLIEAIWFLLFSPSSASVLLLMALFSSSLAFILYQVVRKRFGERIGFFTAFLLLTVPFIQQYSGVVMLEIPSAFFAFLSLLYYGRYLNKENNRDAVIFGIFASLTILTKPIGLALALVPLLSVLMTRRYRLLSRLSFWLPVVIVGVACAPWYLFSLEMAKKGMIEESLSLHQIFPTVLIYLQSLSGIIGIGLILFISIGFSVFMASILSRSNGGNGVWIANGAFIIGLWGFICVVTVHAPEERHLCVMLPSAFMFLAAGICKSAKIFRVFPASLGVKRSFASGTAVLIFIFEIFAIPSNAFVGFAPVVQDTLLTNPKFKDSVMLIASDPRGEGAFIAEVASSEKRPGHVVLRASKFLTDSNWNGDEFEIYFNTTEDIAKALENIPVGIVAIDLSTPVQAERRESEVLLLETLESSSEKWEMIGVYPIVRDGETFSEGVKLYRLIGHETMKRNMIHVNMNRMLNRTLMKSWDKL